MDDHEAIVNPCQGCSWLSTGQRFGVVTPACSLGIKQPGVGGVEHDSPIVVRERFTLLWQLCGGSWRVINSVNPGYNLGTLGVEPDLASGASTTTAFWWCVNILPLASFWLRLSTVPPSRGTTQHVTLVPSKYVLVSCQPREAALGQCVAEHKRSTPAWCGLDLP